MFNFVHQGGRAASPQNGRPTTSAERRAAAANAKVHLKGTKLNHRPPSQQSDLRGQQYEAPVNLAPTQRRSNQGQDGQKRDQYDTDAESLDTTMYQSNFQSDIDEITGRRQVQGHQEGIEEDLDEDTDENQNEENDDDEMGHEGQYFEGITDEQIVEMHGLHGYADNLRQRLIRDIREKNGLIAVEGDSYPSTTTGPIDNSLYNGHVNNEQDSDEFSQNYRVPLPQRPAAKSPPAPQVIDGPFRRPPSATDAAYAKQRQSNIFQTGANLRGQQRSNANTNVRGQTMYTASLPVPPTSQLPTYSQANNENVPNSSVHMNRNQNLQLLAPGLSHGSRQTVDQPCNSKEEEPDAQFLQQQVKQQEIEHPVPKPLEDYDQEVLFSKAYDELKNESFDVIPRKTAPVLPEDMLQKPLAERLEHVQKNIDPERRAEFFSTLPTAEWEDSGDWFLDRFSAILQRTKEARQHKRKLAKEFENEIEQRYKHVSKKQHQVQGALNKMKAQGESLVPRSPRASKSPKPKKR